MARIDAGKMDMILTDRNVIILLAAGTLLLLRGAII
jgi:hypothetical protein